MDTQAVYEVFSRLISDFPRKVSAAISFSGGRVFVPANGMDVETLVYISENIIELAEENSFKGLDVFYSLSECETYINCLEEHGIEMGFLELDVVNEEVIGLISSEGRLMKLFKGIHLSDVVLTAIPGTSAVLLQLQNTTLRDYSRNPENVTVVQGDENEWLVITRDYRGHQVIPAHKAIEITLSREQKPTY